MQTGGRARQALDGRVICLTPAYPCRPMLERLCQRQRHQCVGCRLRVRAVLAVQRVVSRSSTSLPLSHHRLTHIFLNLLLLLLLLRLMTNR